MFSFSFWYFEEKWVGRAMGNETIYWDGLRQESIFAMIWLNVKISIPKFVRSDDLSSFIFIAIETHS